MDSVVDVNFIVDGQLELFDYLFLKKVGFDADKNYVYLVEDKYRDKRTAKFHMIDPKQPLENQLAQFFILASTQECKYIHPIYDFTISKKKDMALITMPVPERSLFSVIKDTNINLRTRLGLIRDITNGVFYMHIRRRVNAGQIRPETILVYEAKNGDGYIPKNKAFWMNSSLETVNFQACLNNFQLLTETGRKLDKRKWRKSQMLYYEAPQFLVQFQVKKKKDFMSNASNVSESQQMKSAQYHVEKCKKAQIWSTALVIIQTLSGSKISQLLDEKELPPAELLKNIRNREKSMSQKKKKGIQIDPTALLNEYKTDMTTKSFYDKILRHIYNLRLRALLERMLAFKPKKRPQIGQVHKTIEKLEVVDKVNKNINKISAFYRSFRNMSLQSKQENQNENNKHDKEDIDDKKSVISMKSVRSGRSVKSHCSQTRKRTALDFPTLLNVRQEIVQVQIRPSNSLYRSYNEDCTNRLMADQNYAPPAIRLDLHKNDKFFEEKIKGDKDEDIRKWKLDQVSDNKMADFLTTSRYSKSFYENNIASTYDQPNWLISGRDETLYQTLENGGRSKQQMDFGPNLKEIPKTPTCYESGYNDNLLNYHYLGVLKIERQRQLGTALFRPENINSIQGPEKPAQFIVNLQHSQLQSVPISISKLLSSPNCLKYLDVSHNLIEGLSFLALDSGLCANLMVLNVSFNQLTRIDFQLWKLKALEECFMTNNSIESMKGFEEQIKEKEQGQTSMEEENEVKKTCQKLKRLYLSQNKIHHIENIFNLPALEVFSLKNNPLVEDDWNMTAVRNLKQKKIQVYI